MAYNGNSIHDSIEEKITEVRSEYNSYTHKISDAENDIREHTTERENIYTTLASMYLPEAEAKELQGQIKEAQDEVTKIFQDRSNRRDGLVKIIKQTDGSIAINREKLSTMADKLNNLADNQKKIELKIIDTLKTQDDYNNALLLADQKDKEYVQGNTRLETFKDQANSQISTYENNKLFKYLIDRKFDTNNYTGNVITTWFDTKIAGFINFKVQNEQYQFLKTTPDLLKKEVSRLETEAKDAKSIVKQLYTAEAKKQGLDAAIKAFKDEISNRDNLMSVQESLKADFNKYNSEISELDTNKSEYHIKAVGKLKSYLKDYTIQDLKRQAQATPGSDDDKLVQKIESIDSEIRQYKDDINEYKIQQNKVAKKVSGLEEIERNFQSNNYDGGRSRFKDELDISDLLTGFLIGKLTADSINSTLDDYHYTQPEPRSSYTPTYHDTNYDTNHDNGYTPSYTPTFHSDPDPIPSTNWGSGNDSGFGNDSGSFSGGSDGGF